MSQGIYKITNKINNKNYIGKSINIEERQKYHKMRYKDEKDQNKLLYKAFRKYGLENFSFEIIEEIEDLDIIDEREKYWIQYYNAFNREKGYNLTLGGEGGITCEDPRVKYGKLTNEEVVYLRKRFLENKYPNGYIYECEFKDKISKRGFQAIQTGQNAKGILSEVFTEENKKKDILLSRAWEGLLRRRKKISLEKTLEIRERIKNGETYKSIWISEFRDVYSSVSGFRDAINIQSLDERIKLNGTLTSL